MFHLVDFNIFRKSQQYLGEVAEVVLDSCQSLSGQAQGLTDKFTELEALSIVNMVLASLVKMPSLPELRKLELKDNNLSGSFETLSEKCANQIYLTLSNIGIKELSNVEVLQNLKSLHSLDLLNREITSVDNYGVSDLKLRPGRQRK
ncbi:acidic leucine-rich nuclear phosphoprotein 32 family member E-like [Dunckerocampus dactyliophorus]|uniref:acidic leucine-rich nuclear phosphoprotein 32 family member E-like n=1 Tax=Dunckerocampus dactyliophorus TaxID=161453 RepID=UPI002404FDC8|nr:acidic leucine-rich nuclear phosphoprotein 32 family member E-like [Dunckerocampus dactyliophorus]